MKHYFIMDYKTSAGYMHKCVELFITEKGNNLPDILRVLRSSLPKGAVLGGVVEVFGLDSLQALERLDNARKLLPGTSAQYLYINLAY